VLISKKDLLTPMHKYILRNFLGSDAIGPVSSVTTLSMYDMGMKISVKSSRIFMGVISLTVFLNQDLACKIEDDLREGNKQVIEAWNKSGFGSTGKSIEVGNSFSVYGGSECPINETVGLGMMAPVEESMLEEIEQFYHSNKHASVIRVCPLAHASLVELTQKRGYILNSFTYRWILDLAEWQPVFDRVDPRVRIAMPNEEMEWARAVSAGFDDVDDVPEDKSLDIERAFFRMASSIPVLAIENDVVSAGGVLALNNGIAALFATSTRPSCRKRGLQTALLEWRLRFAKEHGARIATIETDPGSDSQRNAERIGFRLAYVTAELIKHV
jgi:GNAT superfamily N-acetyltransferase